MVTRAWLVRVAALVAVAAVLGCSVMSAWGQAAETRAAESVAVDPLQCWWRTTAGAVRIGETFSLVLTCAVVENEAVKVVPDQSRLDPAAMQLPPFELVGGTRAADLRTEQRRFFQYEYRLRLINSSLFGKDAKLPETRITYRVQTRAGQGGWIEGRELVYVLPAQSVRVLTLVPADATDIREASPNTFGDIDALSFRSETLSAIGAVLFALAILMAVIAAVRLVSHYHVKKPEARGLLSDSVVLRGVERELSSIREERLLTGWTPELVARALAGLRIAAGYVLTRPVSQLAADAHGNGNAGALTLSSRRSRGQRVHVSGAVTAQVLAQERARISQNGTANVGHVQRLEEVQNALDQFTRAQYGREATLEESALDGPLTSSLDLVRQLKTENAWVVKKLGSIRTKTDELGRRIWAR